MRRFTEAVRAASAALRFGLLDPLRVAARLGASVARDSAAPSREEARIYQLAFWPDDKRAMATDFIACALFASIQ